MANYSGKNPNTNAYIKNFIYGPPANLWKTQSYTTTSGYSESVISPASINFKSLYIPGDLFVDGNIVNPSDINLKKNIEQIDNNNFNKLNPVSFKYKNDIQQKKHFGLIAQELEAIYPELVSNNTGFKSVNYIELIPIILFQMKCMQQEIDKLKEELNEIKKEELNKSV